MIYLDNAATTKPLNSFIESSKEFLENSWYNPSAVYKPSVEVKNMINETRALAEKSLNNKYDCIFTSCGTESANIAIMGSLPKDIKGKKVITTGVEHPCVFNTFKKLEELGANVIILKTNNYGQVDFEDFKAQVDKDTVFISVMHVNNITGGINDINMLYDYAISVNPNVIFHSDGVQGYLKTNVIPKCHIYTASGHKINALKGIGILFLRKDFKFKGGLPGGGQENGFRSGTENTIGIFSLKHAIEFWYKNQTENLDHMNMVRSRLIENLKLLDDVVLNSPVNGASHIVNFSFLGMGGEILLHTLESLGILVSTGSACSSRRKDPRISNALGMDKQQADSQLRISFTHDTTVEDIDTVSKEIINACNMHRQLMRRRR